MRKKDSTNKGGRPKSKDPKKEAYITVRFTENEVELLNEKVKQFGRTRSEFIRQAVLHLEVKTYADPKELKLLKDIRMELRNLGTNINAIAHRANTEKIKFDNKDVRDSQKYIEELRPILAKIHNGMIQ